jgi:hypothetical protein
MAPADKQPKRVILRLRVDDTELWSQNDFDNIIEKYLASTSITSSGPEHTAYYEPFQD